MEGEYTVTYPTYLTWLTDPRRARLSIHAFDDFFLHRAEGTALVEARLHAGRAHQVRAHLAAAGFPLVGDDRYGAEAADASGAAPAPDLRLHAAAISLIHPVTGVALMVEAPAPAWARR